MKVYDRVCFVLLLPGIALLAEEGRADFGPSQIQWAPGEILVRLNDRAAKAKAGASTLAQLARQCEGEIEPLFPLPRRRAKSAEAAALDRWVCLKFRRDEDPLKLAEECRRLEGVEWAQPNYLRQFAAADDSLREQQWNLAEIGWEAASAEQAAAVIVAVVDSGLDYRHPDIAAQVWQNRAELEGQPEIDDDGNGYIDDLRGWDFTDAPGLPGEGDYRERDADPMDESGHGTHVAGIIAAGVGNRVGIAGVAPGVRLMPLRAGFNLPGGAYLEDDDLAAAIAYAVDNGAQVINMSWGDPYFSPLLRDVVQYADQAGCVLVAAVGNEGSDEVFYPARLDETIAVAATAPGGRLFSVSNWGASVDLAAPGYAILSLVPGGGYAERSGTSMAAAHVSGLAARVLARHPHWTPSQVRAALMLTARDLDPPGWDPHTGAGMIQAAAAQVDSPAVLRIATLREGEVLADTTIVVQVEVAGLERWEVSWGSGSLPSSWEVLGQGIESGVAFAEWPTALLLPGPYLLRAVGWRRGVRLEDRVEVQLVRQGPEPSAIRLFRALAGSDWAHLVEWRTEIPAGGSAYLVGEEGTEWEVPGIPQRLEQRLELPKELASGVYRVEIQAMAGPVKGRREAVGEIAVAHLNLDWPLTSLARFPDGYLLPLLADLDADGRGELALMPYRDGQYNSSQFYRLTESGAELIHTSSLFFIPWNLHDLDGDGRLELMAVDAQRVRLLESRQRHSLPDQVIWEKQGVWGGEAADLDGDGRPEIFLRGSQGSRFEVYESSGDNRLAEIGALRNPTQGANELGPRQIVGDLDGDGWGELVAGDGDGDLFAFEAEGNDLFHWAWQEEEGQVKGEARIVGGGADLDGDGRVEFAVVRLFQEPYQLQQRHWTASVYQAIGDNRFAVEWQVEGLGGKGVGSGISVADLDGDGQLELLVALVPDLYVFKATGSDRYEPIWHLPIQDTQRPAVGDLDGDGRWEVAVNTAAGVELFSLPPEGVLAAPAHLLAYPLDEQRVALAWDPVPGATAYRVFRDGEVLVDAVATPNFEDTGLEAGQPYAYAVAALELPGGRQGLLSRTLTVRPEAPPRVLAVERVAIHQLAVHFNIGMAISYCEPYRFRVEPGLGIPASVLPDRGGCRVLLGFASALPDSGDLILVLDELRSLQGTPLALADRRVPFVLKPPKGVARPLWAEALSATRVALGFSRPVILPADPGRVFAFAPQARQIVAVEGRGDTLVLVLDPETPLQPLGRQYEIEIHGLEDEAGRRVEGLLTLRYAASDLAAARPLPNPFFPRRGPLTFGFLPSEARVSIYDFRGELVQVLVERDGDGGIQWDGLNAAGQAVASGVYFFQIASGTQTRTGKFALIRE